MLHCKKNRQNFGAIAQDIHAKPAAAPLAIRVKTVAIHGKQYPMHNFTVYDHTGYKRKSRFHMIRHFDVVFPVRLTRRMSDK